ncbi:MAG: biotin transporter BioY [Candidatus Sericytochromatia bacterium]
MLRVLIRLEGMALFLTLLILSTFVHLRMPYISILAPQLPDAEPWISSAWLYAGTYTANLQLLVVMACVLLLNTPLATMTMVLYLLLGLVGLPIYYNGGGLAYLQQPTTGYLISLIPAAWFCGLLLHRHPRRVPLPGPYLLAAVLTLIMIHVLGAIYAAVYFQMVPVQFIGAYVLPQLPWQITLLCLMALAIFRWNRYRFTHLRKSKSPASKTPSPSQPAARRRLSPGRA